MVGEPVENHETMPGGEDMIHSRRIATILAVLTALVANRAAAQCMSPNPICPMLPAIVPEVDVNVCDPPAGFVDRVTTPSADITIDGIVDPNENVAVTVDGVSTALDATGHFSNVVPGSTDPAQAILISATLQGAMPRTVSERKIVLHAPVVVTSSSFAEADGPTAFLQFTTAGLDKLKAVFEQGLLSADFDSQFARTYYNQSYLGIFYQIAGSTASIGDVHLQYLTPVQAPGLAAAMLFQFELERVHVELSAETFTCDRSPCDEPALPLGGCAGFFEIPSLQASAMFVQTPTSQPGQLQIQQLQPSQVTIVGDISSDLQSTGGAADCPLILSDFQSQLPGGIMAGLQAALDMNFPDTKIAAQAEQALNSLSIAAPIGSALGMQIDTEYATIRPESLQSLSYQVFTRMQVMSPDQCSIQFADSWGAVNAIPDPASTTPSGADYDVALGASPSSINPILTGLAEQGKLSSQVTMSAVDLGLCTPDGQCQNPALSPASIFVFSIRPSVPPFVTGRPGPGGTMSELHVNLLIDISVELDNNNPVPIALARVAVDTVAGLDFVTRRLGSEVGVRIAPVDTRDVTVHVLDISPLVTGNEDQIVGAVSNAIACRLPSLANAVGSFSLPQFEGFELRAVEIQGPVGSSPWFVAYMVLQQPQMVEQTFNVPADSFTNTGIILPAGTPLEIAATGTWSFDGGTTVTSPRGIGLCTNGDQCLSMLSMMRPVDLFAPDLRLGVLMGFDGVFGEPFEVGERYRGASEAGGSPLFLAMNDVNGTYSDNTGSLSATVSYAPPHAIRTVDATVEWVDTGLDLVSGAPLVVTAAGQWSNSGPPTLGPDGHTGDQYPGTLLTSADLGALIGRVGEVVFPVGSSFQGSVPASGRLYLSINDVPGTFSDNEGFVDADVASLGLSETAQSTPTAQVCSGAPPPTPSPAPCVGDCGSDDVVTIDDLIRIVNIALGVYTVGSCPAADANNDGTVTIDELVRAVNAAFNGCHQG
jgi:hypothetical protein